MRWCVYDDMAWLTGRIGMGFLSDQFDHVMNQNRVCNENPYKGTIDRDI